MRRNIQLLIAILTIAFFSLNKIQRLKVENTNIPVGALLCLSGTCAEWGTHALNGALLAITETNESGGINGKQLKLIVQDSKEDSPASAVSGFKQLTLDSSMHFIVGPTWTAAGLAIAPLAAKQKNLIMVSPTLGVSDFNEAGENLFNTWPHDEIATKELAHFARDNGYNHAAIASSQQPWEKLQGEVFAQEFSKLGGSISIMIEPLPDATDLRVEVSRIVQAHVDVVIFTNFAKMGIFAKQLRTQGFTGAKLAILMDDTRVREAQGALDGTVFARYPAPSEGFVATYRSKFGIEPGPGADTAYDAVKLYAETLRKAPGDNTERLFATYKTTSFSGASGRVEFDDNGGVIRKPLLFLVRDGAFHQLSPRR